MTLLHQRRAAQAFLHRTVNFILCVTAITFTSTVNAASISAETRICFGYTGSVDRPVLSCSPGTSGGNGGVIIGGSGVGSGINVPFQSDGFGTELSASAGALQDYGIFRGYAHYHRVEQHGDIFGGVYAANAFGSFEDTWTILGGTGQGRLLLTYTVTGGATADLFIVGGNGSESAGVNLGIGVSLDSVFGAALSVNTAGTYPLFIDGPDAMLFTFGVPFKLSVNHAVSAGGSYNRLDPPDFFQLDANASFEHTAILSGIAVTDRFGTPIANFSLSAESGTVYPLVASPVPLPAGIMLLASGVAGLCGVRRQRRMQIAC